LICIIAYFTLLEAVFKVMTKTSKNGRIKAKNAEEKMKNKYETDLTNKQWSAIEPRFK